MRLQTIADYEAECARVEEIIAKSSRRVKGQWITYLHRLKKEMQIYKKNNAGAVKNNTKKGVDI